MERIYLPVLREELEGCAEILVRFGDVLSPVGGTLSFRRARFVISAHPYISFLSGDYVFSITHIISIERKKSWENAKKYIIKCADYAEDGQITVKEIEIEGISKSLNSR